MNYEGHFQITNAFSEILFLQWFVINTSVEFACVQVFIILWYMCAIIAIFKNILYFV